MGCWPLSLFSSKNSSRRQARAKPQMSGLHNMQKQNPEVVRKAERLKAQRVRTDRHRAGRLRTDANFAKLTARAGRQRRATRGSVRILDKLCFMYDTLSVPSVLDKKTNLRVPLGHFL